MKVPDQKTNEIAGQKRRPLIDLLVSVVVPSVILMKFSGDDAFGASGALILALAFPVCWGALEFYRHDRFNYFALLGLVSVALTGGIGLLQLDKEWLALKEAAIPGLIGLAVLGSAWTRHPLIKAVIYNLNVFDVSKIQQKLERTGKIALFETRLLRATYLLSGTFFFSSLVNYILASWIVTSPTGSTAFNEELGRLTLLSYPMIAIPSTLMMMAILYYIWQTVHDMTGLSLEDLLASEKRQ
jgi:intracellular septation protein A